MKTFHATRCQLIATVSLVCAVVPLAGVAQEQELNEPSAAAPPQVAQMRFVSDKLVLNVYAEPDQSSARIATIQTGDVVEELERSDNLVRVRLENGREGWVGANYLTSDEPAAVRLRELQREQKAATRGAEKELAAQIASLKKEGEALKKENATLRLQLDELQSSAAAASASSAKESQIMAANAAEITNDDTAPAAEGNGRWAWLMALVLTGGLGFAGGYQTLARRLRRKFGGLKIY